MLGTDHSVPLHVFCIYGFTNARQKPEAKAANEELLQQALRYAACLGDVPCCVLGDLNTNEDCSPTLFAATQSNRWVNAAVLQHAIDGKPMANTCYAKETSVGSRIDHCLLNQQLSPCFRSFHVQEERAISVHCILHMELNLDAVGQKGKRFPMPKAFPDKSEWRDPDEDAERYQAWELSSTILEQSHDLWEQSCQAHDANALMKCLSRDAEVYLAGRAFGQLHVPKAYRGRGTDPCLKHYESCAPHSLDGEAQDSNQMQMGKLVRRVEELVRKYTHRDVLSPVPEAWAHLWHLSRQQGQQLLPAWEELWQQGEIPDLPSLRELSRALRDVLASQREDIRKARADAWQRWFAQDWNGAQKENFCFRQR